MFKLDGDILKEYIGFSNNVIIPNGVTTIENNKILKEVYIPKSVRAIENFAFNGCVN